MRTTGTKTTTLLAVCAPIAASSPPVRQVRYDASRPKANRSRNSSRLCLAERACREEQAAGHDRRHERRHERAPEPRAEAWVSQPRHRYSSPAALQRRGEQHDPTSSGTSLPLGAPGQPPNANSTAVATHLDHQRHGAGDEHPAPPDPGRRPTRPTAGRQPCPTHTATTASGIERGEKEVVEREHQGRRRQGLGVLQRGPGSMPPGHHPDDRHHHQHDHEEQQEQPGIVAMLDERPPPAVARSAQQLRVGARLVGVGRTLRLRRRGRRPRLRGCLGVGLLGVGLLGVGLLARSGVGRCGAGAPGGAQGSDGPVGPAVTARPGPG